MNIRWGDPYDSIGVEQSLWDKYRAFRLRRKIKRIGLDRAIKWAAKKDWIRQWNYENIWLK